MKNIILKCKYASNGYKIKIELMHSKLGKMLMSTTILQYSKFNLNIISLATLIIYWKFLNDY